MWKKEIEDDSYRRYIAEVLRLSGENLARLSAGSYIVRSWGEAPEDKRSGDEIAVDVIKRAGLKVAERAVTEPNECI